MKKTRVAFCLRDMQMGGVESVLVRTLDELQKNKNLELNIITYVDVKTPIYKKYFAEHPQIKVNSLYPCSWLGTKMPHFFLARLVVHFLRDVYRGIRRNFVMRKFKDIDVFIDYHDFGFSQELKKIKKSKKIAWFHSALNVFIKHNFKNKLKYYDKTVVLTDECKNDLKKLCPQYADKIIRIYNPIDIKSIKEKSKGTRPVKSKYFCCVSRLSGDKDIKTVLDAFEDFYVVNNKPKIKMVFVGDGDKSSEYKQYANNLKSKKQILFVGAKKEPFVYMKNSVAHILSSYNEGFGLVLIEAASVGVLNISSDCKYGPSEILLNGRGGILFEPGNVKQLSKCLSDVYNNKPNIKKMIQESSKTLTRFESKSVAKEIISLIS